MTFRVRVERGTLRFAAAHMATIGGDLERLHGHNYSVTVEVAGALTPDSWVIDFAVLKSIVRALCAELDHRIVLQGTSRNMRIVRLGGTVEATFGARRYTFPEEDVLVMPVDNTTAERLAEWLAVRISGELAQRGASNVTSITVGVEESPGQSGWFTLAPG